MYTLYGFAMSSASQRVRSVLNYKQLKYENISIDFTKKQNLEDTYKAIHPRMVIPALINENNQIILESLPICEYLEEKHPQRAILSQDPILKAKIRGICEQINSSIQPFQHPSIFQYVNTHSDKQISWKDQWNYWNKKGIQAIEKTIQNTSGQYCLGDTFTLADILLYCQIDSAQTRFQIDFSDCKNVMKVCGNVQNIEEIEQARGIHQKDFPKS